MAAPREISIQNVTAAVVQNLRDQHDWTNVEVLDAAEGHARPLIKGLPPKLLYLHPDDQIAALSDPSRPPGEQPYHAPEEEWVLAVHPAESWSIANFSQVFGSLEDTKPRGKRLVLAMLHNDSTVVYYLMHEGMVKPRQN
ncbi:putative tRNA-splicing endonuclease subunit tsp-1 [Paramyrothecium foliicola]|nr:putative tRNA-splicing endonuclease subunit tsp-1 [Paramyrothecium foliicola]